MNHTVFAIANMAMVLCLCCLLAMLAHELRHEARGADHDRADENPARSREHP